MNTDELRKVAEAALANIGTLPLCEIWMAGAIRHCQRNLEFDVEDGANEPDRYAGTSLARLANSLPAILALLDRLAALEAERDKAAGEVDGAAAFAHSFVLLNSGNVELAEGVRDYILARTRPAAEGGREALRLFVGAAYPVATEINARGHNWCEAYLDEALALGIAALADQPASDAPERGR